MNLKVLLFTILSKSIKGGLQLLGERRAAQVSTRLAEELSRIITVNTEAGKITFYCPGDLLVWRAETILTKEPDTIKWIDTFCQGDVFWDIGANIGVYSLYAALKPAVRVLSFEPAAQNFYILNQNIAANKKDEQIQAYCLALSDSIGLGKFLLSTTLFGSALHTFVQSERQELMEVDSKFHQAAMGFSIDEFIEYFSPPFPNHLKIDVDGNENKIIEGARKTLNDQRLKSILVELDGNQINLCHEIVDIIIKAGYCLVSQKETPDTEQGSTRLSANYIFARTNNNLYMN